MTTLLHLDTSLNGAHSASRAVTAAFRAAWEREHPRGHVVYRDLAADPVPHLDADGLSSDLRETLIRELESADAVLIGAPMYNYAVPSTLKAWLDHVIVKGRTGLTAQPSAAGTPVTVVASRGGAYGPGTPQEGHDFVQNYLHYVLGTVLALDVSFIVPELTLAPHVPAMAELVPLFERSRADALVAAETHAKSAAARVG
ncbi:NAD(P)H-dependent oxidoreductase [Streptomyces sp. JJ66]|uniref:FMN-dependent NADH-azoreductase n=1 Tax=Streptomyces sp. JJ66 TaxID=2803843 RepID=UPI001C59F896|nr:NAD(P)H-dependent oxidoreductase [Streptomyces sp. JJ66]MBW1603857.1 NAD(P)H-dependent oxidoreductase [Streptomyces sp. JJ66]